MSRSCWPKLFESGDSLMLEQENHRRVNARAVAHQSRAGGRLQVADFSRINGGWHWLGIVFSLFVLAVTLSQPGAGDSWPQLVSDQSRWAGSPWLSPSVL